MKKNHSFQNENCKNFLLFSFKSSSMYTYLCMLSMLMISQEEVGYIQKRLKKYTKSHIHKLNGFDCVVILTDIRTLFSYIALMKSMIKTHQIQSQFKSKLKFINQHSDIRLSHNAREPCNLLELQTRKTIKIHI